MKYKSFQEYLLAHDLTDSLNDAQRKSLQKQWRKDYQKYYHKTYSKKRIRKTITLSVSEDRQLKKILKEYDLKLNDGIKQFVFAYLNQTYVVPKPEIIEQLIIQIRKIGTNINQIAHHANTYHTTTQEQLDIIYKLLYTIEETIINALCTPPRLDTLLQNHIKAFPNDQRRMLEIIRTANR
ncbi:plasmid mobilization relaxosome protein MobC [Aureispira sp. CCB-QB1]|uniref:plasmid mobilization relaxosome protein MobC n=1 Tax=Aureispira sp. CCB-QB1 TaxID=1313421 RepID=UPI0006972617|nr:plasmid mobilization relaxosome protein MobC [Aureispira sp. CCB-QB1]